MNAIQVALACYHRTEPSYEQKLDDIRALSSFGIFSDRNIAAIVDMEPKTVSKHTTKTDRSGGAFNPECLDFAHDIWADASAGGRPKRLTHLALGTGTSPLMLERLTGIPKTTLRRWAKAYRLENPDAR